MCRFGHGETLGDHYCWAKRFPYEGVAKNLLGNPTFTSSAAQAFRASPMGARGSRAGAYNSLRLVRPQPFLAISRLREHDPAVFLILNVVHALIA